MTEVHGLTVEQVSDARLVEWMCQVRPGLSSTAADVALQALRTLHMTIHRDSEPCGEQLAPVVCGARDSGLFGRVLTCVLEPHESPWHYDGNRTEWQCMDDGGWRLRQAPVPRHL